MSFPKDFEFNALLESASESAGGLVKKAPALLTRVLTKTNPFKDEMTLNDFGYSLGIATVLDRDSTIAIALYSQLNETLSSPDNPGYPYARPLASAVADALLYQTGLPLRRRYIASIGRTLPGQMEILEEKAFEFRVQFDHGDSTQPILDLNQNLTNYKQSLEDSIQTPLLPQDPPSTLLSKAKILGPAVTVFTEFPWTKAASPQYQTWTGEFIDSTATGFAANPDAFNLLTSGHLKDVNRYLKARIWYRPVFYGKADSGVLEDTNLAKAANYYFSDPDLQKAHLIFAILRNPLPSKTSQDLHSIDKSIGQGEIMLGSGRLVEWMAHQDPETFDKFLETMNLDELKVDLKLILNKLVLLAGHLKSKLPQNANIDKFLDRTEQEVQKGSRLVRHQVLQVLKGATSGIVYGNINGDAGVKIPSPGQTKEAALAELAKIGVKAVFVSDSGWVEPAKKEKSDPKTQDKEPPRLIIPSTQYNLPGIGKLHETQPAYAITVLEALEERNKYPTAYTRELDELSIRPKNPTRATHILFPVLLPKDHPIRALETAGVIAIAQIGNFVEVIVNAERAWLKPEGNLALQGEISNRRLVMEGTHDPSSYSKIHRLVEAGLGYLAQPDLSKELQRDEIAEVRRLIKDWKCYAKALGLPTNLSRVDSPLYRDPNRAYTLVQVGAKHDILEIVS